MNTSIASSVSFFPTRESRREAAPFLPFSRIPGRTVIWSVLLGIGVITPLATLISFLHLPSLPRMAEVARHLTLEHFQHPGVLFLRAVIMAPVLEELFYRGLILPLLRRYTPLWFAIGFTSLFFGVTHLGQGLPNAVNAFALGIVFSWLSVRARSLLPSMLCHATVNFSWLFLILPGFGLMERFMAADPTQPLPHVSALSVFPAWWLGSSVALIVAAVVMLRQPLRKPVTA